MQLTAHPDTFTANNALNGIIGDVGIGCIQGQKLRGQSPEVFRPLQLDFDFGCKFLQITFFVLPAGPAIKVMVGDEQFIGSPPDPYDFRSLGMHLHAVLYRQCTGGHQAPAFDMNITQAAPPIGELGLGDVTKVGDVNLGRQCGL